MHEGGLSSRHCKRGHRTWEHRGEHALRPSARAQDIFHGLDCRRAEYSKACRRPDEDGWLFLLPTTLNGEAASPYIGILVFLGLPAPFFAGLVMVPLGIWLKRRREGRKGIYPPGFPPLNWHNAELRKLVYFVTATTMVNLAIA